MKYAFLAITIICSALFLAGHAQLFGATTLPGAQWGTGLASTTAGNVGKCLSVQSINPLTFAFSACAGGGGSAGASFLMSLLDVNLATTSSSVGDLLHYATSTNKWVNRAQNVFD